MKIKQKTSQETHKKSSFFNQAKYVYFRTFCTVFENHKKKVAFEIASEASYVYILSGQKLIKDANNGKFVKT